MNIANKLTMARVFMIPIFLGVVYWFNNRTGNYIGTAIFVVASLTDLVDGYLARKYNLITDFGKFMDPLADKLLVCAALLYLVEIGRISAIVVIIIISREFVISGFRLVAATNQVVIAASMWGKIKTATTMVMVVVVLLHLDFPVIYYIEQGLILAATAFTVISGVDYIYKNKNVFHE